MKVKLASLGLLALAPMAAQAEMVEMQDTELAEVKGQQGFGLDFSFDWTQPIGSYVLEKSLEASTGQSPVGTDGKTVGTRYFYRSSYLRNPSTAWSAGTDIESVKDYYDTTPLDPTTTIYKSYRWGTFNWEFG